MRRTYRDEVSEESRKMIREYIKFDGRKPSEPGMCRSYEVPFMDGTDLKLGIRSGFYDATITKNIQGEKNRNKIGWFCSAITFYCRHTDT